MKEKKDIVENWLPRYTGTPLAEFGAYTLLLKKAPGRSGAFALEGTSVLRKKCQYLLPPFGAAMLLAPEPASSDGSAVPPLLDPLRVIDPEVMPFSCCVFLPELAPGLTTPSLDAPGAVWFCADAMSVEPNSDATTRAEIAGLDRIRKISVELQDHSKPRVGI